MQNGKPFYAGPKRRRGDGADNWLQGASAGPISFVDQGPPEIQPQEIEKFFVLGDGSFGTVYQGRCRAKDVAVKVLHKQEFDGPTLAAFKKEVEIVSKIFHPNIVLFMGACTVPGHMAIVTELMPKGNLESLLRDHKLQLSIVKRLSMAKDAALGMTWLHCSRPPIVHRDLKASNLLVDESFRVKLCDFGLAQVKKTDVMFDGAEGARGTPLWMAPEVLSGQAFNEKCDVYSFGIVLWEIITRREPFEEFKSFKTFRDAVVKSHVRPVIPHDCTECLRALVNSCWHPSPEARPAFPSIVTALETCIVNYGIRDPVGRSLWGRNFSKTDTVPWSDFMKEFYKLADQLLSSAEVVPPDQKLPESPTPAQFRNATSEQLDEFKNRNQQCFYQVSEELKRRVSASDPVGGDSMEVDGMTGPLTQLDVLCIRALLAEKGTQHTGVNDPNRQDVVSIERFGHVCEWFGPLHGVRKGRWSFMERIKNLLSRSWFHGFLSTREAESALASRLPGTFLIRFSTTSPGCFTISKVSQAANGKPEITHQRIVRSPDRGFVVGGERFESLRDVAGCKGLALLRACPGSRFYTELFLKQPTISGYINIQET
mmetsp:Transcript_16243/g.45845  ORF Transcript_16243/g.45845 Transcript_16243/m.45845 type:complete len:598 (+) Transcript_16243:252-2045(+)|eukprot:CAMPEP_0119133656 /NCGR_PEP_ID=MMETSP1310-20130426/13486_1 /TAXON_ID=464262 /ORGANISM="Genus nov. species nov., Strain RCC2339" /LENGTH=597 /DNA_ID=CAMNT_0007124355 /DNA_START=219 /DNA_END=2012 /DNA_ORIENTATION=-